MTRSDELLMNAWIEDFTEYVKWTATTSIHKTREDAIACCLLGIMGEISEFAEEPDPEKARKELGDVAWYIGHLIYRLEIIDIIPDVIETHWEVMDSEDHDLDLYIANPVNVLRIVGALQESFKKFIRDDNWQFADDDKRFVITRAVSEVLHLILVSAQEFDVDMLDILKENQEKLNSRKERNVISGSGSDR